MDPRPTPRFSGSVRRVLRTVATAMIASALVAGIAWAVWDVSTVNTASITADTIATPGSPAVARTPPTGNGCTSRSVSWTEVPGADGYDVLRNVDGQWVDAQLDHPASPYNDASPYTNYTIEYRVLARFENWRSPVPATAEVTCGIGDVDDLVAVVAPDCKSTTLTWSAVPGANRYRVQRSVNGTWNLNVIELTAAP